MARPNASVRPQASVAGQANRAHLFESVMIMSLREISRIRDRAPCSPARPLARPRCYVYSIPELLSSSTRAKGSLMPASRRSWADWAETHQVSGGVAERSPSALQLRLDLAAAVEGRAHVAESSARAGPVSWSALPQQGRGGNRWPILSRLASR